jgi:hypothetical protein
VRVDPAAATSHEPRTWQIYARQRGRDRQIAAYGRAAGTPRRRAAHPPPLLLLAAARGQRALSSISQTELAHDDSPQTKLDKLGTVLAQTSTPIENAAVITQMLSLPNDGRSIGSDGAGTG